MGLDVYAPVDDDGRFTPDVDFFAGQFVFDANDAVNEKLREVGALLGTVNIEHSVSTLLEMQESHYLQINGAVVYFDGEKQSA